MNVYPVQLDRIVALSMLIHVLPVHQVMLHPKKAVSKSQNVQVGMVLRKFTRKEK